MSSDTTSDVPESTFYISRGPCSEPSDSRPETHDSCQSHDPSPTASNLPFSDTRLNLLARYVRKFLDGSLDWYHLIFNVHLYDRRFVPICGRDEMNFYNYVMACPKDSFKRRVWENENFDSVTEKCVIKIQNPFHFVYVLDYINNLPSPYYYQKKLPRNSLLILGCLWKEGLQTLFEKENEKLPTRPFCFPVRKTFKPTEKGPTEYFLYLRDGSPLYFEKDVNLRNLDDDEWTELQLKLGNCLI